MSEMPPPVWPESVIESPPPPLPTPRKPIGIGMAIVLCAVFYGCSMAPGLAVMALAKFDVVDLNGSAGIFLQQIFAWPITLWVAWLVVKRPFAELFPITPFKGSLIAPLIIAGAGIMIVSSALASLIPMPEFVQEAFRGLGEGHPLWIILAICVMAPVAEELLFRGLILRQFLERYPQRKAVVLSALLFAVFHLNPWQAIVAFALGIVAAWLVIRTGSLGPPILLHAAINTSSSFLQVPLGHLFGYGAEQIEEMQYVPWEIAVAGVFLTVLGLVWLWRVLERSAQASESVESPAE